MLADASEEEDVSFFLGRLFSAPVSKRLELMECCAFVSLNYILEFNHTVETKKSIKVLKAYYAFVTEYVAIRVSKINRDDKRVFSLSLSQWMHRTLCKSFGIANENSIS